MRRLIPVVLMLAFAGCEERTLVVESNTDWDGYITGEGGGSSVQGSGNRVFRDFDSGTFCWTFQKDSRAGTLRAYMKTPLLITESKRGDATTNAEFGVVSGCSSS